MRCCPAHRVGAGGLRAALGSQAVWLHLPYAHARLIAAGYLLWLAVLMFVTAFLRDVHEFEKARAGSADAQRVHADGCVR